MLLLTALIAGMFLFDGSSDSGSPLCFSTSHHESLRSVFSQQMGPVFRDPRNRSGILSRMRKCCC